MTISTYSELVTAVSNWLSRADLSSRVPEFITLAQARINRQVRVKAMQTKTTNITIDAEYEDAPADLLEVVSFYLTSTTPRQKLEYLPADSMLDYTTTDKPRFFTVTGASPLTQFRFAPQPASSYTATILYYAKPATLATTTQETNSLFPTNADLYLYAALLEAESFIHDDPRLPIWKAAYDEALHNLNESAKNSRHGGPLTTRPDGPVY